MSATAALTLSACGGATLDAPVATMIEFEATWQCDVTRFTFASVQEIDDRRDQVRERFGVSVDDNKVFTDMLEDDTELRGEVATLVDASCPSS